MRSGQDGIEGRGCVLLLSDHIKIIMKLQDDQHTDSLEVWLNRSPMSRAKNKRSLKQLGGVEIQNDPVGQNHHNHMWRSRIRRGTLAADHPPPPEEQRVPAPYHTPQSRVPVPLREILTLSDCENQWRLWLSETRAVGITNVSLKRPVHRLTC